jgi:hypothetical protein
MPVWKEVFVKYLEQNRIILNYIHFVYHLDGRKNRYGSVGIGLDNRDYKVSFPAGAGNFSLHHRVQNGSGAHPASYPMGAKGSFPGVKAAVA